MASKSRRCSTGLTKPARSGGKWGQPRISLQETVGFANRTSNSQWCKEILKRFAPLLRNYFHKGFSTRAPGYPSWNLLWVVVGYGKAGRAHHKRGAYEARRWTSHHLSGDALSGGVREPNSPRSSDNSHTGSGLLSQDRFVGR